MAKYRLTLAASADLDSIHASIFFDRPVAAEKVLTQLFDRIEMLSEHQNVGEDVRQFLPDLRRFTVPPYVIYFRPRQGLVEILRILHGARDVSAAFFRDNKP